MDLRNMDMSRDLNIAVYAYKDVIKDEEKLEETKKELTRRMKKLNKEEFDEYCDITSKMSSELG